MEVINLIESKAVTASPVQDLIARRWSPREFSSRPVEPEKLASLFQAARLAPSSYNQQPWSFSSRPCSSTSRAVSECRATS